MKQQVTFEQRSKSLRSWHRRAAEFRLRGLTTHGKPRQRRVYRDLSERAQGQRQVALDKYDRRSIRRQLQGLTTRGTPRVYRLKQFERVILAAEFDALAGTLAECFEWLPPKAQAKALEVAQRLAELKRRMA